MTKPKRIVDMQEKIAIEHARMAGMISRFCGLHGLDNVNLEAKLTSFRQYLDDLDEKQRSQG